MQRERGDMNGEVKDSLVEFLRTVNASPPITHPAMLSIAEQLLDTRYSNGIPMLAVREKEQPRILHYCQTCKHCVHLKTEGETIIQCSLDHGYKVCEHGNKWELAEGWCKIEQV